MSCSNDMEELSHCAKFFVSILFSFYIPKLFLAYNKKCPTELLQQLTQPIKPF